MRILMVCLGNICRSPLAEGILKSQIKKQQLEWEVDSAGTSSWHIGELPDHRSIETAKAHGIDITDQRARQLIPEDIKTYDLILAMDSSNYADILRFCHSEEDRSKVKLMLNFSNPGKNLAVPDPYYDGGFEKVYHLLDEASKEIISSYQ